VPQLVEGLSKVKIIDVSCGLGSIAIDTDGKLYSWGPNGEGFYRKPTLTETGHFKGITVKTASQSI